MFEKILVPLDGSELAECVLPYVEALAKKQDVREVILMRACEAPSILADYPGGMPGTWEEHVKQMTDQAQNECSLYLGRMEQRLRKQGIKVKVETSLSNAADTIVDYAASNGVDLIVMASHGRSGVSRWAYGSVADKVFRASKIPVLMVKTPPEPARKPRTWKSTTSRRRSS